MRHGARGSRESRFKQFQTTHRRRLVLREHKVGVIDERREEVGRGHVGLHVGGHRRRRLRARATWNRRYGSNVDRAPRRATRRKGRYAARRRGKGRRAHRCRRRATRIDVRERDAEHTQPRAPSYSVRDELVLEYVFLSTPTKNSRVCALQIWRLPHHKTAGPSENIVIKQQARQSRCHVPITLFDRCHTPNMTGRL